MSVCWHFSQRATCPPRAAVRQLSMADMTFNWPRLTWPVLAQRQAGPWARKISATSIDGRGKRRRVLRRWPHPCDEMFERAGDLAERLEGDARIERGGIELLVPEQHLDHANVGLLLQQMRGEAVPQRVQRDGFVDLGHLRRGMAGPVELPRREWVDWFLPGKQPALRASRLPPRTQQFEQVLGQHDVAVLAALALFDPNDHPGAVDVGDLERDDLGRPQPGAPAPHRADAPPPVGSGR